MFKKVIILCLIVSLVCIGIAASAESQEEEEEIIGGIGIGIMEFTPKGDAPFWYIWEGMPEKITDVVDTLTGYYFEMMGENSNHIYARAGLALLGKRNNVLDKGYMFDWGQQLETIQWVEGSFGGGYIFHLKKIHPYVGLGFIGGKFYCNGDDRYTHTGFYADSGVLVEPIKSICVNFWEKWLFPGKIEYITGDIKGAEIGVSILYSPSF